jgi:hypothetical protein
VLPQVLERFPLKVISRAAILAPGKRVVTVQPDLYSVTLFGDTFAEFHGQRWRKRDSSFLCLVVMGDLDPAGLCANYDLGGVKCAKLSQCFGIPGRTFQRRGLDEVRRQTRQMPQGARPADAEQERQHEDGPLIEQPDAGAPSPRSC